MITRDRWRCRKCGRAGRIEVDHVVPLHVAPFQKPYDLDGLQSLCRICHFQKTSSENRRSIPVPADELRRWRRIVAELA